MFNIVSISTPNNSPSILIDVNKNSIGIHSPLGPAGSKYVLVFPNKGYITITDAGSAAHGPGDWAVAFSGSSNEWTYSGEGQAKITINDNSGTFTVSGGANTITGKLVPWNF